MREQLYRALSVLAPLLGAIFLVQPVQAGPKKHATDPNDVTSRLFELLDSSHDGKLDELYLLADTYTDPKSNETFRHVLKVEYDKNRAFGRLRLYVRSVGKMTPEQLSTYTPKQIFDFGEEDQEKYVKTDPGPFGQTGDLYLRSAPDSPLASAPITGEVRKAFETYLTEYILPALQKKN